MGVQKGPIFHAHAQTRACTHTHTAHARTNTPTAQHMHPDDYLCTNAYAHARSRTKHITTMKHGHAQTLPATHSHSHTYSRTHSRTHAHTRTQTHIYTHPRNQAKTYTTHSRTHAHASLVFLPSLLIPFVANPRFPVRSGACLRGQINSSATDL